MFIYTVVRGADRAGFDISVIGDEGARHTMLGFKTEVEAEAWIDDDKNRDGSGGLLMPWRFTRAKPFVSSPTPQIRQAN